MTNTLVDVIQQHAAENPEKLAFRFLESGDVDGDISYLTYGDLIARARALASELDEHAGRRALLLYPPGLDFVVAFTACLLSGTTAIPMPLPERSEWDRGLRRLRQIITDAGVSVALSTSPVVARFSREADDLDLTSLTWIAGDVIGDTPRRGWAAPTVDPDGLAFLQYTSGSTSTPRGVEVTHKNLMHNQLALAEGFGHTAEVIRDWEGDLFASWLPVYHDMGLIAPLLQTLFFGKTSTLMSPLHFVAKPERWLTAISTYRAHTAGAPNFGYELSLRRATPELTRGLDLSYWRTAFNGAEPVRPTTLRAFAKAFAPSGFRAESLLPVYGLAEATLMVTASNRDELFTTHRLPGDNTEWVNSGRPPAGIGVRIADPDNGVEVADETVGEIWVSGDSVAKGYLDSPEKTAEVFRAELGGIPHLRTGDLGFLHNGNLHVTGRSKDLIVIDGKNHYPQDIELTIEQATAGVRPGCIAAFSYDDGTSESVVVVAEIRKSDSSAIDAPGLSETIRRAVSGAHGIAVADVVLVEPRTIYKTSSGKIQRQACRTAYLEGSLAIAARAPEQTTIKTPTDPPARRRPRLSKGTIEFWLQDVIAERVAAEPDSIGTQQQLTDLGLGSKGMVELSVELGGFLGRELEPTFLFTHTTIAEAAAAAAGAVTNEVP
ncbi:AMP-binding protein [Gordonia sp. CPCC 205333]|uniref:AMP-binding protein n=1 Tax=Gordonia sp. CPCC 205333 TaxID=3140790 RepID=UPI003AF377BC